MRGSNPHRVITMFQDEKREGWLQQGIARLRQEFQTKAEKQEDRKSRRQRIHKLMTVLRQKKSGSADAGGWGLSADPG